MMLQEKNHNTGHQNISETFQLNKSDFPFLRYNSSDLKCCLSLCRPNEAITTGNPTSINDHLNICHKVFIVIASLMAFISGKSHP